jgi:ADP-ribose pyrophosphatase YjhB (NUDIX family)
MNLTETKNGRAEPNWLFWSRRLAAIAQTGLRFGTGIFDRQRYEQIREIAGEMLAAGARIDGPVIDQVLSRDSGYATPKVGVRAAVFQDGKILLVRERADGRWCMPGGYVDVGDSPSEAAVREVREESGFEVRAVKLLAVVDKRKHPFPPQFDHVHIYFFRCELTGGQAAHSIETDGVGFFGEDSLPPLSEKRLIPALVHRMFEHYTNPNLPTDFD